MSDEPQMAKTYGELLAANAVLLAEKADLRRLADQSEASTRAREIELQNAAVRPRKSRLLQMDKDSPNPFLRPYRG